MMRLLSILLGLTLMLSGLQAAAFEKVAKSKDMVVKLSSQKPLALGNNTIMFQVFENEKAVTGDQVSVKIFMPAMPGMPAMEEEVEAKALSAGKYESVINFSMRGTWQIHIFVTPANGKKYRVKTSINI